MIVQSLIEDGEKGDEESGQERIEHNVKQRDLNCMAIEKINENSNGKTSLRFLKQKGTNKI